MCGDIDLKPEEKAALSEGFCPFHLTLRLEERHEHKQLGTKGVGSFITPAGTYALCPAYQEHDHIGAACHPMCFSLLNGQAYFWCHNCHYGGPSW